ncbi:MAG TPA: hypothetical protein VLQ45_20520 [Thermoanaerobaculia bacterium]|nr:hypothetical protein [Thermoanaerobaculia bacterium]
MELRDLDDHRVGEQSAREIAFRFLPLFFKNDASGDVSAKDFRLGSINNLPGFTAEDIFRSDSLSIYDLKRRLLFRDLHATLYDGTILTVRVAATTVLGSPVPSIFVQEKNGVVAQDYGALLKAIRKDNVVLKFETDGLTLYAPFRLGVLGARSEDRVVIDLDTKIVHSVPPLGEYSPLDVPKGDRSAAWQSKLEFVDQIWQEAGGDFLRAFQIANSTCICKQLSGIMHAKQDNDDFCVPAVTKMALGYHGIAREQPEIATVMGTVIDSSIGSGGTLLSNEVAGYGFLSGNALRADADLAPTFQKARSIIGENGTIGYPLKAGRARHAVLITGWRTWINVAWQQLFVYDPIKAGKKGWEDCECLEIENYVYVMPT